MLRDFGGEEVCGCFRHRLQKKSHESSPHKDEHYLRKDRQIGDKNSLKIISINKPEKISTSGAG